MGLEEDYRSKLELRRPEAIASPTRCPETALQAIIALLAVYTEARAYQERL